jgi:hypothetical protein
METITVDKSELVERLLWWQKQGLSFSGSGYGGKIPTRYLYKHNNILKRVYCACYGNSGTCYVVSGKDKIILRVLGG